MPDARGQIELRSLALLAVRDISKAIDAVNAEAGTAMVRWPLDIQVMRGSDIQRFDFALLHKELESCQAKEGE